MVGGATSSAATMIVGVMNRRKHLTPPPTKSAQPQGLLHDVLKGDNPRIRRLTPHSRPAESLTRSERPPLTRAPTRAKLGA